MMSQNKMKTVLQAAGLFLLMVTGITAYLFGHIPLIWQILLALSAACFVSGVWMARADLKHTFSRRATRYGLNSVLMSVIVLAIVVTINLIAMNHDAKIDITKNKVNTLSEQSIKIVQGLKQDVRLRAFISPNQKTDFETLLDKYGYYSKRIVKEYVDVDKDPMSVKRFDIKQAGTIIVETDTRSAKVENLSGPDDPKAEEKLTNAIIQVEKGDKKKIYFVNGHGERLINDSTREGYSEMRDTLGVGRFLVEELNLVEKDKIPADAEIVIIPGPKKDLMTHEIAELENYLRGGGKVLLMLEPDSTKSLDNLLQKNGIEWHPGKVVVERNPLQREAGGNPVTPVIVTYDRSHEITKDARYASIFAMATPIEKAPKPPEGLKITSLFMTSGMSLESTIVGNRLQLNEKTDRKGPLSMAVAVSGKSSKEPSEPAKDEKAPEAKLPEFRLVVVGDADFAANGLRKNGYNSDLFQNMLSWLAHEEDLISIRPKATDESTFDITEQRMRIITLASCFFLPFAMFISGISVWIVRRRK
jgi:ABC-type uncharacterized transport system involved in gliding motility auxiliary subunit